MMNSQNELPDWTREAGGEAWRKWINRRIVSCIKRAQKWADKRPPGTRVPERKEWCDAIWKAMDGAGRGHYSHLPLSLKPWKPTAWNWPSLDHVKDPATAEVVLEVRLVNDMKTIMSEQEFRSVIGHLAAVLKVQVQELPEGWQCDRSFAVEEPPVGEPPLPE